MSVLIRGMEMPENCVKCLCFERCYTRGIFDPLGWCHITGTELLSPNPPQDCPLVHVPPHGRLIDADALEKDIDEYIGGEETRSRFHHWVQVQRTVIPESKEART